MYASGIYAYVVGDSGFQIVNVSDPSNPFLEGSYPTSGVARSVDVSGDYAYVADGGAGLLIINVSDPSNPYLEGSYNSSASVVHVSGNYAYVGGLQIINVSNPSSPFLEGSYNAGAANGIYVSGNSAYVATSSGLEVINVSDPSNPFLETSYATPGSPGDVHVSGEYAFVADGSPGLRTIRINDPVTNVTVVNSSTISATVPAGLFEGDYHVLVTNPGMPSEKAYLYKGFHVTGTVPVDYYCDNDSDAYINLITDGTCTGLGCQPPGCATAAGMDCDDSNSAINPDTYWYQDYDGDGFGNYSISLQQCDDPSGAIVYVLDSNDYNDGDPNTGAPVYIPGAAVPYYSSLQAAYDAASDGDTIQVIAVTFNEDLFIDRDISVTFECGYDGLFSNNAGITTLTGNITITGGILYPENLQIE